jgi:hypothetical protein
MAGVNLLSIPLLISVSSISNWNQIVVSQAIGGIGAIIVGFGWGTSGPAQVAMISKEEGLQLFRISQYQKVLTFTVLVPICLSICHLLLGLNVSVFFSCVGAIALGLSNSWYFIGTREYRSLFYLDTCPRVGLAVLGLILCKVYNRDLYFLISVLLAAIIPSLLSSIYLKTESGKFEMKGKVTRKGLKVGISEQRYGFYTVLMSSLYVLLPIIIVEALKPQESPEFNLGFKFAKIAAMTFIPISQFLQGWVSSGFNLVKNLKKGYGITLIAATFISALVLTFGIRAGLVISNGLIHFDYYALTWIAVTVFFICSTQYIGLTALMTLQKAKLVAQSTFLGSVVGLPLIACLTIGFGSNGGFAGVGVSEFAVFLFQFHFFRKSVHVFNQNK